MELLLVSPISTLLDIAQLPPLPTNNGKINVLSDQEKNMSYIHGVFSNQTIFVWGCLLKLVPTLNETDTEYFFLMHRLTSNIKRQRAETIRQSSSHHYTF